MRIPTIILTAIFSTACVTFRVDIPEGLEFARTDRGTWKAVGPTQSVQEAPRAVSAPSKATPASAPKKASKAKPKRAAKPTADSCKALREVADSCDAQLKVEECKTSCEPKAATP